MRRKYKCFLLFMSLIYYSGYVHSASGVPHPDPKNDSLIPITGWPFYLENLEIGTPVSDYGSHFGVKASVDNDGDNYPRFESPNRLDAKHFMNMAHYSAITSFYGQVDQSFIWFEETSPNTETHLKPAATRSIQFSPWGWTETASDPTITATGKVMTLDTDTFLFVINVKNLSGGPITIVPHFTIFKDSDPQREGTNVPGSSFGECNTATYTSDFAVLLLLCNGKRESKDIKFARGIYSNETIQSINLITGPNYNFDIKFSDIVLQQNETKEFYITLGYSAEGNADEYALFLALVGKISIESNGLDEIINKILSGWYNFFYNLPSPHTYDNKHIQLYKMSATALRMNLYKKRNKMPADCSVPGKAHFNFFWAWDTPFHTIGQSEWDVQLAKDNLSTQFSGQLEDGMIRMVIDDNLSSTFWPGLTQPPVQGWAIKEIAERDNFSDTEWLREMYEASKKYLDFWEENRDSDGDGLYEFASGLETGWDDTPRFHCGQITNICVTPVDTIDSLDLNSWLYQYYSTISSLADKLRNSSDSKKYQTKAESIARNIENLLWNEERGAFFDRELTDGEHQFINVLTPATFLPLTVGAIRDVNKVKRVIEGHLLNPDEFWGIYPVPTVAYNDEKYDHHDDGYYWQGQIWLITAYSALKALYRYGYEDEAEELKKRILDMMFNADPGGIHETYDALTGKIGWGAGSNGYFDGIGEPSVFQFGWSSAFTMEMILERYQRERFLMPDDKKITGFVKEIINIKDGSKYIMIKSNSYEVPKIIFESGSELPIIDSKSMYLKLEDPYNIFNDEETTFKVYVNFGAKIGAVSGEDGSVDWINIESDADGNYFTAKLTGETTGIKYYFILPQQEGCGCVASGKHENGFIGFILLLLLTTTNFVKSLKVDFWKSKFIAWR